MSSNDQPSGWAVGWTAFAGITMIMMGIWWAISGLVAIFDDEFYVVGPRYIFELDVSTWGWVHLTIGAVVLIAGFFLFKGAVWARTVGVIIAVLSSSGCVCMGALLPDLGDPADRRFDRDHLGAHRPRTRHRRS